MTQKTNVGFFFSAPFCSLTRLLHRILFSHYFCLTKMQNFPMKFYPTQNVQLKIENSFPFLVRYIAQWRILQFARLEISFRMQNSIINKYCLLIKLRLLIFPIPKWPNKKKKQIMTNFPFCKMFAFSWIFKIRKISFAIRGRGDEINFDFVKFVNDILSCFSTFQLFVSFIHRRRMKTENKFNRWKM